jgi:methyl-accepting chemotaxis protein
MTLSNGNNNRLDRIEQILEGMIAVSVQSNQRLDRLEQTFEQSLQKQDRYIEQSNQRLDRLEQTFEQSLQKQDRYIEQSNQRLDRLEQTVSQLATVAQTALTMSQSTRESLQQTEQLTRRNASAIARLEARMDQYITEGREHREFIATQVEGIKTETRRILTHLFGEADNQ